MLSVGGGAAAGRRARGGTLVPPPRGQSSGRYPRAGGAGLGHENWSLGLDLTCCTLAYDQVTCCTRALD